MDIFTRTQWRSRGLSTRALEHALRTGEIRRVIQGAYAGSDVPDTTETRCRAIALVRPRRTVIGRQTSAWMSGIDVFEPGHSVLDQPIWLLVGTAEAVPRIVGCCGRQAVLPDEDLVEEFGVVRTSDLRTALDLGRFAPRQQAVASLDAFLHAELVTHGELWQRTQLLRDVRGCRLLRRNLEVADGGAESYAESAQRLLFIDAGLPRPKTQIPVFGLAGDLIGYLDMGWKRYLQGSEYDGEEGHGTDDQREHDKKRRSRVHRETPWAVDVARREQLWGQPAGLVAKTAELLLPRGWQPETSGILDQISRAAAHESLTGQRWKWMPLERLMRA
ncbi:MAG TPA: type IV toxin-antitoxin system AbiEi family antitoxin domain-containing protein [Nocardioidaceae bacterium]|nr:type IV toxin-antitoxin system AbiEi family antitoxin domain-containing protein [Nocardioidaceae bacterium]